MRSRTSIGAVASTFIGAIALLAASNPASAAMTPAPAATANPNVQLAWCAAGVHIGPLGACVGGPGYYHRGYYGHRHCWRGPYGHLHCRY